MSFKKSLWTLVLATVIAVGGLASQRAVSVRMGCYAFHNDAPTWIGLTDGRQAEWRNANMYRIAKWKVADVIEENPTGNVSRTVCPSP